MRNWIIVISLIFLLYSLLGGIFHPVSEFVIAFIMIGVIGMSHGSIDHILATEVLKILPKKKINLFIALYLGVIGLYAALWLISPPISFILFLLYSAYHFGQADTEIITQNIAISMSKIIGFNYGLLITTLLINSNSAFIISIFPLWFTEFLNPERFIWVSKYLFWACFSLQLIVIIALVIFKKINLKQLLNFNLQLLIVILLLNYLPPLTAFSIYFGLWHSLLVLQKEFQAISKEKVISSPKDFIRKLVPFTIISLIGLVIIVYLGRENAHFSTLVFISVLAFPHTILMDRLYSKRISNHSS